MWSYWSSVIGIQGIVIDDLLVRLCRCTMCGAVDVVTSV